MVWTLMYENGLYRREKTDPIGQPGVMLILFVILLTGGLFISPAFSQELIPNSVLVGTGTFDEGPDGDPFADPIEIRHEIQRGEKIDSLFPDIYDPLHKLWDPFAEKLSRNGLEVTFQYTAMIQNSSDLIPGIEDKLPSAQNTLSGGDADLMIKWNAYQPGEASAGYFRLSAENRHSYSKLPAIAMGPQTGSLWLTMRGWTEYDGTALTEFYWHQGTLDSPFEYRIGRVKNTTIWNGGKYIGGNTGIVGGQVTGTPAMVTLFSGWSVNAVYHPVGGTTHITAGVFQSNGDNEDFKPLRMDELIYALQVGWKPKFWGYKGRYHIFAWHVDETDDTSEANGFAVNAEHKFGNLTPFFRYSFGDQDRSDPKSHSIRQNANIGIGYDGVFGQSKDWAAIVATWAEPTDETLNDQYGLEFDYSFRFTPHIILTPHVQLIQDPSMNTSKNNVLVIGLRARMEF